MTSVTASAEFFCRSLGWGLILFSLLADDRETGTGLKRLLAGISLAASILGVLLYACTSWFMEYCWSVLFFGNCLCFSDVCYFSQFQIALHCLCGRHDGTVCFDLEFCKGSIVFLVLSGFVRNCHLCNGARALVFGDSPIEQCTLVARLFLMGGLLAVKLVVVGYSFWAGVSVSDVFGQMLIVMRIIWGYAAVGVMGYFGYRLARMRSIQSATGILYAMTFAVFIGELGSHYLHHYYGVWL